MGISTTTAARIYKGQKQGKPGEEDKLNFERFGHTGLSKASMVTFLLITDRTSIARQHLNDLRTIGSANVNYSRDSLLRSVCV